jgi:hypothetical protein
MSKRPIPRQRRILWIMGGLLGAFVVFTVAGFLVAPSIIKAQLEKRASAALGRTVTLGKVRMNPYAMAVTLENLNVSGKEGAGSFLGWERLYVNFDPLASITGTWTFGTIELDGLHVAARVDKDGKFDFDDILQRLAADSTDAPKTSAPTPTPAVHLGSLKVNRARVDFSDVSRYRPFATTLGPLTFGLTEFRTIGQRGAPYNLEVVSEAGERLVWTGTLGVEPFRSTGNLALENIDLAKYLAYYGDLLTAELQTGKLTLRSRYELDFTVGAPVTKVSGGMLQLSGVKIADAPGGSPALELPLLKVDGVELDAEAQTTTVAAIGFEGGRLRVQREKDGKLNLLTMLKPLNPGTPVAPAVAPAAAPAGPAKPWDLVIAAVDMKDFQVDVTDLAAPRPAQLGLGAVQVSLKNITLAENAVIPVQVSFNWAPQGTVKIEGTASFKPAVKLELAANVAALDIRPLSPYLEQFLNARITQGTVSVAGSARVALPGEKPEVAFAGGVTVEQLGLVDSMNSEDLAGLAKLELKDLTFATAPALTATLGELNLAGPYARMIVNADRSLNLLGILKTEPAGSGPQAPPTATTASTAPLPKVEIGRVVIAGGEFSLLDRSLEPHVSAALSQVGGTIGGLSSENLARGEVNLSAMVDGIAPVTLVGKLDPFAAKRFIELEMDIKNMELLPFSPYSGRYAGYELQRGKLSSNLKFKLDGKQMDATDIITLSGFTLGAPVASPEATNLPVRLGVVLLKDAAGQIVIDVPLSGNIDDPDVRLRKAIMRVVVNMLTKVAVSPFSLLGSIVGGGGEELAFQEFHPGSSELEPAERDKLETVVRMLGARPELGVAIEGGYDGPADTYALQRLRVADLVRRRIWEEKHAANPNTPPPGQLEVTPKEDLAMIRKLFAEKFPTGTKFDEPLVENPGVVAAPVPESRPGFFRRVVDKVTFKEAREKETKVDELKQQYAEVKEIAEDKGVPVEEMVGRLAQAEAVTENDLRALAAARAAQVRNYFMTEGKITADRLFLTHAADAAKENKGPRVFLSPQ